MMATIDLQSYLPIVWRPTHYTTCACGRGLELYEIYNGVILYMQRVKPCECGVNYSLESLFQHYGCKEINHNAQK